MLCVFFHGLQRKGGKTMVYFSTAAATPPNVDCRRGGRKRSEKLTRTAYRRAERIRLPLSYYAPAADSSRFVYIIITINFPVEQTSSNGLSLSLCVSVSFALRIMRPYTHCCRPIDPIRRGGTKKEYTTTTTTTTTK